MFDGTFYSDRIGRGLARVGEEVSPNAWQGLVALIDARIRDGSLARDFPEHNCPDEPSATTGTDEDMFLDSLEAHIPGFDRAVLDAQYPQDTVTALDIIDFVALHVDRPSQRKPHDYFRHEHLYFRRDQHDHWLTQGGMPFGLPPPGKTAFQKDIDLLFARNGIAFTLGDDMRVRRLGPVEARQLISDFRPHSGDPQLDFKLADATSRFVAIQPERVMAVCPRAGARVRW